MYTKGRISNQPVSALPAAPRPASQAGLRSPVRIDVRSEKRMASLPTDTPLLLGPSTSEPGVWLFLATEKSSRPSYKHLLQYLSSFPINQRVT